MKISLVWGSGIEVAGIIFAVALVVVAPDIGEMPIRFLVYLLSWGCLEFFPHRLAHFVTGRLVGVRFTHYVLVRSPIVKLKLPIVSRAMSKVPILGLRIEHGSFASVTRGGRAVMFSSGAVASMILPFFPAIASHSRLPILLTGFLLVLSVANLVSDLYYSRRAGDLSRL